MNAIDLTNQRFGRLVVLCFDGHQKKDRAWQCRCDCGEQRRITTHALRSGNSTSCGCLRIEHITSHGLHRSPEYKIWVAARQRCHNRKAQGFSLYGGRGIRMCDAWRNNFEAFYRDLGPRPSAKHSLDRINNDGHYEPGNCRWATREVQMRNRRVNRKLTWRGETLTLAEWTERTGISGATIVTRLEHGWDLDETLTKASDRLGNRHNFRMITFKGETRTLSDWARHLGICSASLSERLDRMSLERALTMRSHQHSNGYKLRKELAAAL